MAAPLLSPKMKVGNYLHWFPIPALIAAIVVLYLADLNQIYLHPFLNQALYFIFSTLSSVLVAYLIGRSFLFQGKPGLLMLGCGVIVWGSSGLLLGLPTIDQDIAFFNICVCLSALCHLSGAAVSMRSGKIQWTGTWLGVAYTISFCTVLFVRMAALDGWLPTFFIQGEGGTPIRQFVLGLSVVMFVMTAILLMTPKRGKSQFQRWYPPAMALVATGVFGVMIQSHHSSLLGWTGRTAQLLGGAYMLVAAIASVRESREWSITVEAALESKEATLTGVLNAVRESIWVFDRYNAVITANATGLERFGKNAQLVIGKHMQELLPEPLATTRTARNQEVFKTGKPVEFEDERAGFIYHHTFYPAFDRSGKVSTVVSFSRDITQKKQAEEALLRAKNELEEKVQERTAELDKLIIQLQAANSELDARSEKLRALAGELTMSEQRERKRLAKTLHDGLQQYLVAAKLQLGGLIESVAGPTKTAAAEIENLLADSIAVSRSLAAELSPPILHDSGLLGGLEWLSRWTLEQYGLQVELNMQMNAPSIAEDVKVLLFESVRELLLNAVKHAGTKMVQLRLEQVDLNRLKITVSDEGKGFDPANIRDGLKSFGLFSIAERVSLIGGELAIDSALGKGARLTITAPMLPPSLSVTAKSSARAEGKVTTSDISTNGLARILLTDDHAVMREGLARLLSHEPDFEIVGQANDGDEAVELAGKLIPDVILMDISMPRLNGIDATRMICKKHPEIRIIGLSLYQEEERATEMLEAGATYYLSKSGPPSDLKAAIRACMQERTEKRMRKGTSAGSS